MSKHFFYSISLLFSPLVWATSPAENNSHLPEKVIRVAEAEDYHQTDIQENVITSFQQHYSDEQLKLDVKLTERLLNQAVERGNRDLITHLLSIYRQFSHTDLLLILFAEAQLAKQEENFAKAVELYRQILADNPQLTPVRIQMAISLFSLQQDSQAKEQFEKALSDPELPVDIAHLIQHYLNAITRRDGWQFYASARYLNEDNVNSASSNTRIEHTGFTKGSAMLPQKAHGIGYSASMERDFNLSGSHYVAFKNSVYGKNYWDNHDFDDVVNRTYLGYTYKHFRTSWSLLPFYEREWYSNHRYKRASGIRSEFSYRFNATWQISSALEYSKQGYFNSGQQDGHNKLASLTLVWRANPKTFLYIGGDYSRETTRVKSFSYDLKSLRLGWGQEWEWGISTRMNASYSQRNYKDSLYLGALSAFFITQPAREDKIYQASATLWKRDWHLWGITPKLNYSWKKQRSNFDTLYSFRDSGINLFLETSF